MKVHVGAGGRVLHNASQQRWIEDDLPRAIFAGHIMMAIPNERKGYVLQYLDYESEEFDSLQAAKLAAPAFAKAVLQKMQGLIILTPKIEQA